MSIHPSFQEKNKSKTPFLLYVLLWSQLAMILALSTGLIQIERICSYSILLSSFGMYVYSYVDNRFASKQDLIFFLFLAYLVMLAIAYSWGYDEIKSASVFLSMLTVWRASGIFRYNEGINKILIKFFSIQGLILIALYFTSFAYESYQEYVPVSSELTLGFSNPNQTGIIIFSTLSILLILIRQCQITKLGKGLLIVQIAVLSILLILTDARTSILGYLVFLLFFLKKRQTRISPIFSTTIICFPIAFVFLYDALSKTTLQKLTFWGKRLFSGRQRVFSRVLSMFTNKLLGNLTYFGFQNAHNALLTILVNTGVVGLVFFLAHTIMSFNALNRKCNTDSGNLGLIAILSLFIMSCAETAVLTGGTIYYVHMLAMLILSSNCTGSSEPEKK